MKAYLESVLLTWDSGQLHASAVLLPKQDNPLHKEKEAKWPPPPFEETYLLGPLPSYGVQPVGSQKFSVAKFWVVQIVTQITTTH